MDLIDLCHTKETDRSFIGMMSTEVMGILHKEIYGFCRVCYEDMTPQIGSKNRRMPLISFDTFWSQTFQASLFHLTHNRVLGT